MKQSATGLLILALAGCSGGSEATEHDAEAAVMVRGSIDAPLRNGILDFSTDGMPRAEGGPCSTTEGYDDLREGTQVVLADDAGQTLALGTLRPGVIKPNPNSTDIGLARCSFGFVISDVAGDEDFYTVSVGRRGAQKYTREQITDPLTLTIG